DMVHALPGRDEVEAAEFLLQLHGLVNHALLLFVVADLDIARQRKILAQRMSTSTSKRHFGSSRKNASTRVTASRRTSTINSSWAIAVAVTSCGNAWAI